MGHYMDSSAMTPTTWSSVFAENGVPEKDAQSIGVDINMRLKKTKVI
jgi:hypothetical protein